MPTRQMTYEQAVSALEDALTFGIHPSLDGITRIAGELDDPAATFVSLQVAGTNGKSSVTRLTAALLHAHGYRVGCYTSPHLIEYRERVEVDGAPISPDAFASSVLAALDAASRAGVEATEFEILTAAALDAFRSEHVDFAVLEVGMGGRWDATSVVTPAVAVITGVALDHTAHLGNTREEIAADKAYIIKSGSVGVLGPGTAGVESVLIARAESVNARLCAVREHGEPTPVPKESTTRFEIVSPPAAPGGATRMHVRGTRGDCGDLEIAAPSYQAGNVAVAVAATEAALDRALDPAAIAAALATLRFPARFEVIGTDPLVIVDGSHNPEAASVLAGAIREAFGDTRPRVLLGVLADKDARGIVAAIAPVAASFVVTAPDSPRALPIDDLAAIVADVTGAEPARNANVPAALEPLTTPGSQPLVVAGSLTTAAEARSFLLRRAMRRA